MANPCGTRGKREWSLLLSLWALLWFVLPLPADSLRGRSDLVEKVRALREELKLQKARIGLLAVDCETGETLLGLEPREPLVPASNMKIVIAVAALQLLGPEHEFLTILSRRGDVDENGVLKGDLVVWSNGEPSISGRLYDGNVTAVFERWGETLLEQGLRTVQGDLICDDTAFDRTFLHASWPEEQLWRWYCAPSGALSFNDNCIDVTTRPGPAPGEPAQVETAPVTSYCTLENDCETGRKSDENTVVYLRQPGSMHLRVRGTCTGKYTYSVTVENPTVYFGTVLRETLERKGLTIEGEVQLPEEPVRGEGLTALVRLRSPLSEALGIMNRRSQNFYADQFLKLLGYEHSGKGSFRTGAEAVGRYLGDLGFSSRQFRIADGSGLSSENRLTAELLVRLLRSLLEHPAAQSFVESLPVAGQDGTLKHRLTREPYAGAICAKTGTTSLASSLSGYVMQEGSPRVAMAVLVNKQPSLKDARAFQDRLFMAVHDALEPVSTPDGGG